MRSIRQETELDYAAVRALVTEAFACAAQSDGDEADYLDRLRKGEDFIPALSLLAEEEGQIVGQIVLYRTRISGCEAAPAVLVLSPLSVRPSHFKRGIGGALIASGCERAAGLGYQAVFVCGERDYYERFGFQPARQYGIYHVKDAEGQADWCLVKELAKNALQGVHGTVDIV